VAAALLSARAAWMKLAGWSQRLSWRSEASRARIGTGWPCGFEVPAEIAGDKLRKAHLTPHREPGAAAAYRLVALDTHILRFGGLAGEVFGEVIALQVRPRQVSRGELLAWVAHPPRGGQSKGLDAARADCLVGGLQTVP